MKFEVINAGKCMLCGKPIELEDKKDTDKLPDIFFCRECEQELEEDIAKTVDGQNDFDKAESEE